MKYLKSIFSKKSKNKNILSYNFEKSVKEVINEIDINSEVDDKKFYEIISKQNISQFEANEIYIFLPIVFAQLLIKDINWNNEYNEILPNKEEVSKRYDQTPSYLAIIKIAKAYIDNEPLKNTILQIAGRSAEFNAVNELILKGGTINDVNVTKTTIIR